MRYTGFFVALFLAFFMLQSPALAGNPCGVNPCAQELLKKGVSKGEECKKGKEYKKGGHYRKGHHEKGMQMMAEHVGMMKEVLTILRDLKHKPNKAQKQRLGEMIQRLEEKEKHIKEKIEKCKEKK